MLAASVVMVAGLSLVAVLSQRRGYRLGGVMVLPLLAVYTFREPLSPVIFVGGVLAAWGALWVFREYTLTHGRRLFLVAVAVGAVATVLVGVALSMLFPVRLAFEDAEVVASIFPGVTTYNVMRLDRERRAVDVFAMVAGYVGLVAIGFASLWVLAGVDVPVPPVLALPTSDVVDWVGIDPRGTGFPRVTPAWLSIVLLLVDVVVYEFFRKRYDLRLAGIIVVPLLAVFSVRYGATVLVYTVGASAVFFLISVVHWLTLLYGRVLLGVSLAAGTVYALAVGVLQPRSAPGITLFFVGLFVGIGAYNLHRVAPTNRAAHVRISAALFVVFYAVLFAFVDVPPGGFVTTVSPASVLGGGLVVALGALSVSRLERAVPDAAAFARQSVFANASLDDANFEESPLVAEHEEDDR